MGLTDLAWWARFAAWLFCLSCLTPAVYRLLRLMLGGCTCRYLDPIWGVVFLLALNRMAYMTHVSSAAANATALVLAIGMGGIALRYQANDA